MTPDPRFELISGAVLAHYSLGDYSLLTAPRDVVREARITCLLLARRITGASYNQLGMHFGGTDHLGAMRIIQKAETRYHDDQAFKQTIDLLTTRITSP